MAENKLSDIIETSLEKIKGIADGETVLGNPISTPNGTTVIPVSKISVGFASGGVDYHGKRSKDATSVAANFGGGGGTGLTVAPIAFLIITPTGDVQLLPIQGASAETGTVDKVTSLIERSPDILERLKKVFTSDKKKAKKTNEKDGEAPAEETSVTEGEAL